MRAARSLEVVAARRLGVLLVTGAPGWFANRLLASLVRDPPATLDRVRCLIHPSVDLDLTAWDRSVGRDFEIVRGDLTDPSSLRRAVRGVHSIVHGGGVIHVNRIQEYYDVNTEGTRSLAEEAAAAGAERMVYLSTNAAGGRSPSADHALAEHDPATPLSHYGRSKWLGERAMFALKTTMERVALRPCMFYGPPVPARHVDVFKRIIGGTMPLVGGGHFARSLTHIDHLVQAVHLALERAAAPGNTYYIADRSPYTTVEVIEAMARALGVRPRFIRLPSATASIAYTVDTWASLFDRYWQTVHLIGEANWHVGVSIARAQRDLGYDPRNTIDEGMRDAVEWCRAKKLL